MQIIPMRDLKDTVKVEKLCKDNGEVFVTKNGYGRLVVMDIDYWSKQNQNLYRKEERMQVCQLAVWLKRQISSKKF